MHPLPWDYGFWHPFGPHGGECAACILARKQREIVATGGWTLWSFQHRTTIGRWQELLHSAGPVVTFCSDSPGAANPRGAVRLLAEYARAPDTWTPIPTTITIPHPAGAAARASAFVVRAIHAGADRISQATTVEWWAMRDSAWRQDYVPTHGEYLLRPAEAGTRLRPIAAILELAPPYVVPLRGERPASDAVAPAGAHPGAGAICVACGGPLRRA